MLVIRIDGDGGATTTPQLPDRPVLLSRHAGRIAGFSEKAVKIWRRDNPEQQQFVIGIQDPTGGGLGNEYRCTILEWVMIPRAARR